MRLLFRNGLALAGILLGLVDASAARPSRRGPLPNVVIIVADSFRPEDLSNREVPTPHLDQLAAQGMRFTQAYAGSPANAASRAALMTGRHTGHSRVRSEVQVPLAPEDLTLAEVLRSAGYRSGAVGIWGLGWEGTTGHPSTQGFDEFLGYLDLVHGQDEQPAFLWRNTAPFMLKGNQSAANSSALGWLMRGATNFVRINEDHPLFLYYAPPLPGPDRGTASVSKTKPVTNHNGSASSPDRAARIASFDAQVGILLSDLRRRKLDADTAVFVTSTPTQSRGLDPRPAKSAEAASLRESALRVPLIAWWPGKIRGGTTNSYPIAAWDLMPTVAELANAPKPQQLDGHSFARLLLAQPTATNDVQFYWEDHDSGSGRAGRIGQWKGIQSEKQKIQLYDLESDPAETRDVGPAHPERVKQFEALFAENYRPWRPPPDAAVVAAGRPGHLIPTNIVTKPMRTNVLNQPSSTPKQP